MERPFKQPSVMTAQQHFSGAPRADVPRSNFDRSHGHKTTFDAGFLVPVFLDEYLPGDTFSMSATAFARLATPLKPFMDNLYLDLHFWAVPNRLLWSNWKKFMGEQANPGDSITYSLPQISVTLNSAIVQPGGLLNYFGIPYRNLPTSVSVTSLPLRAYALVWNEWYRDQNLQQSVSFTTGDGPDSGANLNVSLLRRGKRHDYFTSCLPWPQKGNPVVIPLGTQAPVRTSATDTVTGAAATLFWNNTNDGSNAAAGMLGSNASPSFGTSISGTAPGSGTQQVYPSNLYADLSLASGIDVSSLRTAFQVQRLLERDARGGTRYVELIYNHFGVTTSDARMQRPEYLGGGTTRINVNPLASTVVSGAVPQGNLAGVGTGVGRAYFVKSFEEHGWVLGLASARADLTYQQGIERMWWRQTRYDFYWPVLAHLSEQPVYNREIWVQGLAADSSVFGYQERYAEYRYKPSRISGAFQSDWTSSLDSWHLSIDFGTLPALNSVFIQEDPPVDRVIAIPAEPHFLCDIWFDYECERPMPVYSVPGLIDHF